MPDLLADILRAIAIRTIGLPIGWLFVRWPGRHSRAGDRRMNSPHPIAALAQKKAARYIGIPKGFLGAGGIKIEPKSVRHAGVTPGTAATPSRLPAGPVARVSPCDASLSTTAPAGEQIAEVAGGFFGGEGVD